MEVDRDTCGFRTSLETDSLTPLGRRQCGVVVTAGALETVGRGMPTCPLPGLTWAHLSASPVCPPSLHKGNTAPPSLLAVKINLMPSTEEVLKYL